jgi:hypothetical protein
MGEPAMNNKRKVLPSPYGPDSFTKEELRAAIAKGESAMKKPTIEEVLKLVEFGRDGHGNLYVHTVKGSVKGDIRGHVVGTISGKRWKFVETPKERAVRLIREGKLDEAIYELEGSE